MTSAASLADSDIHGLVDGRLDSSRRAEVLRLLAASPGERARVEAWQEQTDLIRSAFSGVDREPLPVSMRLVSPPPLHCIPSPVTTLRAPTALPLPPSRDRRGLVGLVSVLLFVAAVGVAWMLLQPADDDRMATTPLRGGIDESLAALTSGAVSEPARSTKTGAAASNWSAQVLPATAIPDLTSDGFMFTSAESRSAEPVSIVFRYRDAAGARLVLSVARAPQDAPDTAPTRIGRAYGWHQGVNAYAIAGTVGPQRLHALAVSLQRAGEE